MNPKPTIFLLVVFWSTLTFITCTNNKSTPEKKPSVFFPNAQNFVVKTPTLSAEKVASIEKVLEANLHPGDFTPTFHIATNNDKKPFGVVVFLGIDSPQGVLNGGVGLNMQGKIIGLEIYEHQGASGVAAREFLDQFVGKGLEDAFRVGTDVKPVSGREAISQSVAHLSQKALLLAHALFPKRSEPIVSEANEAVEKSLSEDVEPETLIELMDRMKEAYDMVREYFQTEIDRQSAVSAAKQLAEYIEFIDYFEPPNNPNETEEYSYFQDQTATALRQFANALEAEGLSDNCRNRWEHILDLVSKAHLRFSIDEVDLDEDLE